MDYRLEAIDKLLSAMSSDGMDEVDTAKELGFAILAVDVNDPATLNWLAAVAVKRAGDLIA